MFQSSRTGIYSFALVNATNGLADEIMNAIILSSDQFEQLVQRLEEIQCSISQKQGKQEEVFLDNQQFLQLMNISKRTAQSWRDEGIISFSQIGSKIYYRMKDVQDLLDKHSHRASKK